MRPEMVWYFAKPWTGVMQEAAHPGPALDVLKLVPTEPFHGPIPGPPRERTRSVIRCRGLQGVSTGCFVK